MIDRKRFQSAFGKLLRDTGYRRRRNTWYKRGSEVTVVVNLQKSQYDGYCYVNVALALHELTDQEFPSENHCHVRTRLTSIHQDKDADFFRVWNEVFNLDTSRFAADEQERHVQRIVRDLLLPTCERWLSINAIRLAYQQGEFRNALVRIEAAKVLETTAV